MRKNDYPGTLIVIDGPDGSGTTTQAERLAEELDAVYTAEHGARRKEESLIGEKVEEMISNDGYSPEAIALGFAADRMVHLEEKVIPLLEEGETVVCDRYYHSSLVYQPAMGLEFDWVKEVNRAAVEPDLVVLLDVSADTAMSRMEARGRDGNIFENMDFQQEVAARYAELEERLDETVELVDAELSKDGVFEQVRRAVERHLSR